jgi:hypothetical protein
MINEGNASCQRAALLNQQLNITKIFLKNLGAFPARSAGNRAFRDSAIATATALRAVAASHPSNPLHSAANQHFAPMLNCPCRPRETTLVMEKNEPQSQRSQKKLKSKNLFAIAVKIPIL